MANEFIRRIRTDKGDMQYDFTALGNMPMVITDLGEFVLDAEKEDPWDEYAIACQSAKETGIYKISVKEGPYVDTEMLFVVNSTDMEGHETIFQMMLTNDVTNEPDSSVYWLPKVRKYYYDSMDGKYKWSIWQNEAFEDRRRRVDEITNYNKDETFYYPSVKAVADYVNSAIGDVETALENIITKYGLGGDEA